MGWSYDELMDLPMTVFDELAKWAITQNKPTD